MSLLQIHKDLFSSLQKDITHDLEEDMTTFKTEITELLTDEIIGRYFYEGGAIKWTISTDQQVLKAVQILNNKDQYSSILNGKSGSILVSVKNRGDLSSEITERKPGERLI
jgi:predicted DNA binding protein